MVRLKQCVQEQRPGFQRALRQPEDALVGVAFPQTVIHDAYSRPASKKNSTMVISPPKKQLGPPCARMPFKIIPPSTQVSCTPPLIKLYQTSLCDVDVCTTSSAAYHDLPMNHETDAKRKYIPQGVSYISPLTLSSYEEVPQVVVSDLKSLQPYREPKLIASHTVSRKKRAAKRPLDYGLVIGEQAEEEQKMRGLIPGYGPETELQLRVLQRSHGVIASHLKTLCRSVKVDSSNGRRRAKASTYWTNRRIESMSQHALPTNNSELGYAEVDVQQRRSEEGGDSGLASLLDACEQLEPDTMLGNTQNGIFSERRPASLMDHAEVNSPRPRCPPAKRQQVSHAAFRAQEVFVDTQDAPAQNAATSASPQTIQRVQGLINEYILIAMEHINQPRSFWGEHRLQPGQNPNVAGEDGANLGLLGGDAVRDGGIEGTLELYGCAEALKDSAFQGARSNQRGLDADRPKQTSTSRQGKPASADALDPLKASARAPAAQDTEDLTPCIVESSAMPPEQQLGDSRKRCSNPNCKNPFNTPCWRRGPPENPTLCNACGVHWKQWGDLDKEKKKRRKKDRQGFRRDARRDSKSPWSLDSTQKLWDLAEHAGELDSDGDLTKLGWGARAAARRSKGRFSRRLQAKESTAAVSEIPEQPLECLRMPTGHVAVAAAENVKAAGERGVAYGQEAGTDASLRFLPSPGQQRTTPFATAAEALQCNSAAAAVSDALDDLVQSDEDAVSLQIPAISAEIHNFEELEAPTGNHAMERDMEDAEVGVGGIWNPINPISSGIDDVFAPKQDETLTNLLDSFDVKEHAAALEWSHGYESEPMLNHAQEWSTDKLVNASLSKPAVELPSFSRDYLVDACDERAMETKGDVYVPIACEGHEDGVLGASPPKWQPPVVAKHDAVELPPLKMSRQFGKESLSFCLLEAYNGVTQRHSQCNTDIENGLSWPLWKGWADLICNVFPMGAPKHVSFRLRQAVNIAVLAEAFSHKHGADKVDWHAIDFKLANMLGLSPKWKEFLQGSAIDGVVLSSALADLPLPRPTIIDSKIGTIDGTKVVLMYKVALITQQQQHAADDEVSVPDVDAKLPAVVRAYRGEWLADFEAKSEFAVDWEDMVAKGCEHPRLPSAQPRSEAQQRTVTDAGLVEDLEGVCLGSAGLKNALRVVVEDLHNRTKVRKQPPAVPDFDPQQFKASRRCTARSPTRKSTRRRKVKEPPVLAGYTLPGKFSRLPIPKNNALRPGYPAKPFANSLGGPAGGAMHVSSAHVVNPDAALVFPPPYTMQQSYMSNGSMWFCPLPIVVPGSNANVYPNHVQPPAGAASCTATVVDVGNTSLLGGQVDTAHQQQTHG